VATSQTTKSTTFANLTTAGPEVTATVPSTGNVLVTLTSFIENENGAVDAEAYMGVSTTGACPGNASEAQSLSRTQGTSNSTGGVQASATYELKGLTAGAMKFRACYKVNTGTGVFKNRNLIVMPLP